MAKHDKLTLPVAKAVRTSDFFILKYSSTERGKILDVQVKDTDGSPYDLTGLDIEFVEELYNKEVIVDDGKQDQSGKFSPTDLQNGEFSYEFQKDVFQYDGWAHFKFTKNDNLIDTTAGFAIRIIDDIDSDLDKKSYIAYFEKIKKEHQTWIDRAKNLLEAEEKVNDDNNGKIAVLKKALNDQIAKEAADLKTVNDSIDAAKLDLNKTINDNKTDLTKAINDGDKALSDRLDNLNQEKDLLKNRVKALEDGLKNYYTKSEIDSMVVKSLSVNDATPIGPDDKGNINLANFPKTLRTILSYNIEKVAPNAGQPLTGGFDSKGVSQSVLVDGQALDNFAKAINQINASRMPINFGTDSEDILDSKFMNNPQIRIYNCAPAPINDPSPTAGSWIICFYVVSNGGGNLIVVDTYGNVMVNPLNGSKYDGWKTLANKDDVSTVAQNVKSLSDNVAKLEERIKALEAKNK